MSLVGNKMHHSVADCRKTNFQAQYLFQFVASECFCPVNILGCTLLNEVHDGELLQVHFCQIGFFF